MQISTRIEGRLGQIALVGRFDFGAHRDFRVAYEQLFAQAEIKEIEVDMHGVEYLDSSALGMLLLLKERAAANGREVTLSQCRGMVKQVLEIANFGKLFVMK